MDRQNEAKKNSIMIEIPSVVISGDGNVFYRPGISQ